MPRPKKLSPKSRAAIAKSYTRKRQPATGLELAEEFGVAASTIYAALREEGIAVRPRGRPSWRHAA